MNASKKFMSRFPKEIQAGVDSAHSLLRCLESVAKAQIKLYGDVDLSLCHALVLNSLPSREEPAAVGFALVLGEYLGSLAAGVELPTDFAIENPAHWPKLARVA